MLKLIFDRNGKARALPIFGIVLLVAICSAMRTKFGFLTYSDKDALAVVVPIAGTIVALALPAAQLAQSVTTDILANAQGLIKTNRPLKDVRGFLEYRANMRRADLEAMKYVIYYSLASLLSGLAGLFGTFSQSMILFGNLPVPDFFTCFSATCLITSVLWFLPVIQSSFNLEAINKVIDLIKKSETPASPPVTPESTTPAPSAKHSDA
ncbi:hypothetical protein [Paraburkholderia phenazinium]|nr:hypothetical protein [Paraburkholderia phenazinium]